MATKILDKIDPIYKEGKNINMDPNNITTNQNKSKDDEKSMWVGK